LKLARPSLVPPMLVALGFLPLVALQARSLWDRPHLQAFPLAVAGGLVLARRATRTLGPLEPGALIPALTSVAIGGAMLVVAAIAAWPWLGTAAALFTALATAYGLGGWRLLRPVLPACMFVALAVLPPNFTEQWLVTRLQAVVTEWSSPVLHLLGVLHVTEGNLIKVPGRVLFVEQACSGVRSLLTVLGCTLFVVLSGGGRWFRAPVLLSAAALWVLFGNVVRVVTIAYLMTRFGIDFSTGYRHEALGLVILLAVLGLTLSTDQLLRRQVVPKTEEEISEKPTVLPDLRRTWLGSWPIAMAFGLLGVAQAVWLWPLLAAAAASDRIVERLQVLEEGDLPAREGLASRTGFKNEERDTGSDFGDFSKIWRYEAPGCSAFVSVDFPFRGWHELSSCYQGIGWKLRERELRKSEAGAYVEATFTQADGRLATLLFGLDDLNGTALEAKPFGSPLAFIRNRLEIFGTPTGELGRRLAGRYESMPRSYQLQLFLETVEPLSPQGLAEARGFFDDLRAKVRTRVAAGSKAVKAARAS
jgi:exosortase